MSPSPLGGDSSKNEVPLAQPEDTVIPSQTASSPATSPSNTSFPSMEQRLQSSEGPTGASSISVLSTPNQPVAPVVAQTNLINTRRQSSKPRASPSLRATPGPSSPIGSPLVRPLTNDSLNYVPPISGNPTSSSNTTGGVTTSSASPGGTRLRRTTSNTHSGHDRKPSRRIVFSTDDDESEMEADLEREISEAYKSGFKDGRRHRSKGSLVGSKRSSVTAKLVHHSSQELPKILDDDLESQPQSQSQHQSMVPSGTATPQTSQIPKTQKHTSVSSIKHLNNPPISEAGDDEFSVEADGSSSIHLPSSEIATFVSPTIAPISSVPQSLGPTPSAVSGSSHANLGVIIHEIEQSKDRNDRRTTQQLEENFRQDLEERDENDDENNDDGDSADVASISSTETFTLRERQDAINITHPFGIRIWKPAIYKKIRSVQRFAEGEIHSGPDKAVSWLVWLGNILWSLSFGIVLLTLCWSGALLFRVIFFWSRSSTLYSRILFFIGKYLFFPFGICVQLRQDENYLLEDEGEGRTVAEYQEWQTLDSRRLFFDPGTSSHQLATASSDISQQNNRGSNFASDPSFVEGNSDSTMEESTDPGANGLNPIRPRSVTSNRSAVTADPEPRRKLRFFGRGDWNIGRIVFYIWFYIIIYPVLLFISVICYLGVFSIPMAKVTSLLAYHVRRHPLALSFRPASTLKNLPPTEYSNSILLCTYRAMGSRYYKYTIDGTNIFFINLMAMVAFVIFDYYVFAEYMKLDSVITDPIFLFCTALFAIIPLAYFIGQAVASISAQSSMGMGATINAFFSTVVEVFLYCVALSQGKGDLVEGSIVGSIFGGILLLPGLSMCAGAIKRKTQRYNPKSAGVSSTMLLFAIIGAFAPTIFYQIYGTYEVRCQSCDETYVQALHLSGEEDCQRCHFYQAQITTDSLYTDILKPFSAICSSLLFIAYVIGLWFTLRTHAAMIWQMPTSSELHSHPPHSIISHVTTTQPQSLLPIHNDLSTSSAGVSSSANVLGATETTSSSVVNRTGKAGGSNSVQLAQVAPVPMNQISQVQFEDPSAAVTAHVGPAESGGHDAPNWSRTKSTVILLGATVLYAIIAEILVGTVDGVLKSVSISEKFVGVTIFALVPNTTEFLNAISFAMNGNIALSMEIGSAYVLQVCLLQIPALVAYSIMSEPLFPDLTDFMFTLIFPRWDLLMVIFCVFVFSYIYAEGKSNYFKGSILVLSYLVVMVGFYYTGNTEEAGISQLSSSFRIISQRGAQIIP